MEAVHANLRGLNWDRTFLQGKYHSWRIGSKYPIPGTTVEEDKLRNKQSITAAKLQNAVLDEKRRRGPPAITKIEAMTKFEQAQHTYHFGGLLAQVEEVLDQKQQLKHIYDERRKEKVEEDSTLFRAIKSGEFIRVRRMFELGELKVNSAEPVNLMTGLMKAVQACRPKIVKLFVENNADANQENRYGQVAFHYLWDKWRTVPDDSIFKAVKLIHTIMMAEALLAHNANPNIPIPKTGMTPLHVAAMYGHAQIAQLILMYKGSTAIRDSQGRTALDVCRQYGSDEVAGLIVNWPRIAEHFGITEFRRKWEDFFANDQELRSSDVKVMLTDLAMREKAMADLVTSEVEGKDEFELAEQAKQARREARKKQMKVEKMQAEIKKKEENSGGRTLAVVLTDTDRIAQGKDAVSMQTAMALTVGKNARGRATRQKNVLKESGGEGNESLLQAMANLRTKRTVEYDFKKRLEKMTGRYVDPDELTVEQVFGTTAAKPPKKPSPAPLPRAASTPGLAASSHGSGSTPAPTFSVSVGDNAVTPRSAPSSASGSPRTPRWKRRRSSALSGRRRASRASIFSAHTAVSSVGSRAEQAFDSMSRRRRLAARNIAEDVHAGKLRKKYSGQTYIRKNAQTSKTLRGSRLRVEDDPGTLKSKMGQRGGDNVDEDNVIMQLLSGSAPTARKVKKKLTLEKQDAKDIGEALASFCDSALLPGRIESLKERPKTLLQKERDREAAKAAQIAANKYNVVYHAQRKSMYKNRYGKMQDPWSYAKYSAGDALNNLITGK